MVVAVVAAVAAYLNPPRWRCSVSVFWAWAWGVCSALAKQVLSFVTAAFPRERRPLYFQSHTSPTFDHMIATLEPITGT